MSGCFYGMLRLAAAFSLLVDSLPAVISSTARNLDSLIVDVIPISEISPFGRNDNRQTLHPLSSLWLRGFV